MQQPQPRPLLGDSVSSTPPQAARRNNPVAVLTHQQLQQLQQLQAHNPTGQSLTFALQQPSNNAQEQNNGSATHGNHIVYVNQLNQLNQGGLGHSGTGMGLPPATPTFGVGLNMGLPLSLLNTSLTSLTSNAITTSNPLLNLGLSGINPGLTTLNPNLNTLNSSLNTINQSLSSNLTTNNINSGLAGLGQDLTNVNSGLSSINSGLSGINQGLTSLNPNVNPGLNTLNTNLSNVNSSVSNFGTLNPSISTNLTTTSINQGLSQTLNALNSGLTPSSIGSSNSNSFSFPTIQSIQSLAPHIVSSNITHIPSSNVSHLTSNSSVSSISHISNSGVTHIPSSSVFTQVSSVPTLCSSNITQASNITHLTNAGTMHSGVSQAPNSTLQHIPLSNDPNSTISHITSSSASHITTFHPQRQFSQNLNPVLSSSQTLNSVNTSLNAMSNLNNVKNVQNIQSQNISSPGSPFSIPMKSPASNIAPPTPSPSPNRLLLRSPASNSMQSNRNSPSPVSISTPNASFGTQLQSPMQSPMSIGPIQSPAPSPYPPAKSPHHLGAGSAMNNRSPAPGGSPGPPVVRSNTPILQQGMQVLQIIHGNPQNYQPTPTQLVTRTHLIGNQQIQIATTKPTKQPPQILPKPPNQQASVTQPKQQRTTNTVTSQVPQQSQPQLVLTGPQTNATTATMIPTAQGPLLLNQVLPSSGPVIVQQQPGGVQLILRTPTNAQQQTHTAQLTQQQLVRVVTAQGMQLQGLAPAFFAVPNGFPPPPPPVLRHNQNSPAPPNSGGNPIVIQNTMVQSPQTQLTQVTNANTSNNSSNTHTVDHNLLPPPKKKAKKKKKAKRKDEEPPKLDLASIMKISGIGDDDDMFDTDLVTESETSNQMQIEQSIDQSLGSALTQVSICNTINVNTQTQSNQNSRNSQLLAQLQTPVQNPISGHLRLAVGEDGKFILHHTPEPNHPEIDAATAQALIRSLTQGGGQNSQIISQLLGQASGSPQNTGHNQPMIQMQSHSRQKFEKSPLATANQGSNQPQAAVTSPTNCQDVTLSTSPEQLQISQNLNMQSNLSNSANQNTQICPSLNSQSHANSMQNSNMQLSMNLNINSMSNTTKTAQTSNTNLHSHQHSNPNIQLSGEVSSQKFSMVCPKFQVQTNQRVPNTGQPVAPNQQHGRNLQTQNVTQNRVTNPPVQLSPQQTVKYSQHTGHGTQKPMQSTHSMQVNSQLVNLLPKNAQSIQQINMQQETQCNQQTTQTGQLLQNQNVQHIFQQNPNTSSNLQHNIPLNSVNNMQQNISTSGQQNTSKNVHQSTAASAQQQQQHQNSISQQNAPATQQHLEQSLHCNIASDLHHNSANIVNQNAPNNLQHGTTNNKQQNLTTDSQNVSLKQHKMAYVNTNCSENLQSPNSQSGTNNVQQQKILISNSPCQRNMQQTDLQKVQASSTNTMNSAATSIFNNAPKITPEILNALSNLNPNDQLLIANANGQMQVISQQLLQQFLSGQLNVSQQTQNQNQTQKIVIGEPNSNNQNLQGVQINTPTSQIIVNSSGGVPTIQNNIQNIVVQAAPSQMPQQIQIQNSGFPTQFIDNLNQQQIRSLGNNSTTTSSAPKKAKLTKKVKVAVTSAQNVSFQSVAKAVAVSRTTMTTTTSTQKTSLCDTTNKGNLSLMAQSTNSNKSELPPTSTNGSVVSPMPNNQNLILPNGQLVQRVQTIQLPVQKQQMLKNIQAQIQAILAHKPNNQAEQLALTKLYHEQSRIFASGKVISSTSHPVSSGAESTMSVNVVSTSVPTSQSSSVCKNQTSTAQTQTFSNPSLATTSNTPIPNSTSLNIPSSVSTAFVGNLTQAQPTGQQNIQPQSAQTVHHQNMSPVESKQPKFYQNQSQPMPSQSSTSTTPYSGLNDMTSSAQSSLQNQTLSQQITVQLSTQCQTDPLDVKPNIQTLSPIKQEIPSQIQIQVQIGSPVSQVSSNSPRIASKCPQQNQSPVNISSSQCQIKQLNTPGNNSSPLVSPRQAVKRPASSPICRQMNRSDLLEQQLKIDQNGAINPDMNSPFSSKSDACKRLIRYHCFNEQVLSSKDLAKADEIFEETAKHLLSKFNSMMNKYTYLLLMESMREVRTSELMMIDRTFVAEEQSILSRLREQEAKANEDFKKEEKPMVPKVEPGLADDVKPLPMPANVAVKRELEDDYSEMDEDTKPLIKPLSCTSGDYDEWLEIQKELGVYPTSGDSSKCKNSGNNSSAMTRTSRSERTRANGEYRGSVVSSGLILKNSCETVPVTARRWSGATDLERDLLEDADSLDGLVLTSQAQCPPPMHLSNDNDNDNDDITAQVQSAIDSILNLKQGPSNPLPPPPLPATTSTSQNSESKDAALDQAVRSILGS
ncbi:protein PF14_0175 isoform X1 [Neodiprion lecontei]|uniref:Protein PF14_0175 n=1 Tax=Neodiprion lecontei TaxID=441921 RepID=A0A6J0CAB4_NEOLC|nr:protein PF14_0175 isoform X1 [Neodiprion lecontei]XP_046585846.1 protein PF14_0175 isoform X1 [Neodiprion lecontei]XP_046585847.1 protein PF14_0175 isoform X1 [Neodiprion lecontei]XP_046585848.1 protein PF14_0175 isoform X1 [Neodiprion lecontei]